MMKATADGHGANGTARLSRYFRIARNIVEALILVSLLVASVLILRDRLIRPSTPSPQQSLSSIPLPKLALNLNGAPTLGSPESQTLMVIFSDFYCPYCRSFARDILPQIDTEYVKAGALTLAFRNMPLEAIHPLAFRAAQTALCAGRQNRFWQWHDAMFSQRVEPQTDVLESVSAGIGLDAGLLRSCITSSQSYEDVRREANEAKALGVRGTPTFIIGTLLQDKQLKPLAVLTGARQYKDFKATIDKVVGQQRALRQ